MCLSYYLNVVIIGMRIVHCYRVVVDDILCVILAFVFCLLCGVCSLCVVNYGFSFIACMMIAYD